MRRFLFSAFIPLALLVSGMAAAPVAQAQASCPAGQFSDIAGNCFSTQAAADASTANLNANNELGNPDQQVSQGMGTAAQQAAAAAAAQTPASLPQQPPNSDGFDQVMIWIMELFAWLVGVAAITLNYAMYYTVVTMGNYVNHLSAIGVTWRVLRDIANIMLIFGFLGAGITTILNVELYGWKTKMLPMLLAGAILLNFSLFISEALVDSTNLFATQFYAQINGGQLPTVGTLGDTGISDKIMAQLGLQTIYGQVRNTDKAAEILKSGNSWLIGFMGILLFLVTAFVMFSLAFILIARFVVIVLLLVVSPVAFMGMAIPNMQYRAGQWWKNFLEQIVTAPVLVLLLYVALAVITDAQFLTGFGSDANGPQWLGFIDNGNLVGFASMMLSFLVAMGLLLVVVIKAKSMSAAGAGLATTAAGKLTFGATAFALRTTVGRGSERLSQSLRRTSFGSSKYGRLAVSTLDRGAKASYDVRGTGALKPLQIDAGKAAQGGFRGAAERSAKAHEEYAKSIGKAYDARDKNDAEKAAIALAEESQKGMQDTHDKAEKLHASAKERFDRYSNEIKRLKAQDALNLQKGLGAQNTNTIKAAEANLAASRAELTLAQVRKSETQAQLTAAKVAAEAANKAANDRLKNEKNAALTQYAESIKKVPSGLMYGPGGTEASKKILKDLKKSERDQLLDMLQKATAEKKDEAKEGGEEKPKKEEGH